MKNVLIYGEHPFCFSGNGNMLNALLGRLDREKYHATNLVVGSTDPRLFDVYKVLPFNTISVAETSKDSWGLGYLLRALSCTPTDMFLTVGVDIWRFFPAIKQLKEILIKKKIPWVCIAPYDLEQPNALYIDLFKQVDFPCVYSEHGFNILKHYIPNLKYYRPRLFGAEMFQRVPEEIYRQFKLSHFSELGEDPFMFGFIGNNQTRKQPHKVLKAYKTTKQLLEKTKEVGLYMHTSVKGKYNLEDLGYQWDVTGGIGYKTQGVKYPINNMVLLYNSLDCIVLPSLQEGLSWTVLEAMLCKTPVIASDSTAHRELLSKKSLIPANEMVMIPIAENQQVEATGCSVDSIVNSMMNVARTDQSKIVEENYKKAKAWLAGISDINETLDEVVDQADNVRKVAMKKNGRVLFMQHSAAGDVLMTTRCFKGVSERYKMPVDYMTQKPFMNIVQDNPYINRVVEWGTVNKNDYSVVLNPHSERILPGHWGRNSNSTLSDFYWKILKVDPDNFHIKLRKPRAWARKAIRELTKPIMIVHTTGGDPHFRTYKYMKDICDYFKNKYSTIQLGGPKDYPAEAEVDLRGQLTFQESAWVMNKAIVAVTVDSFTSHLAGALGVSQATLYGSGNAVVCKPTQMTGTLICRSIDYTRWCRGLGPCSGNVKDCPTPCTGYHDPKDIINDILELEKPDGGEFFKISGD